MEANIVNYFESVGITDVELRTKLEVPIGTDVRTVVETMAAADRSCAVITDGERIRGIFTERDVSARVATAPDRWDQPIDQFMTVDPIVIPSTKNAVEALRILNRNYIRNLPIVDADGRYAATLTSYDLIRAASAYLASNTDIGDELSTEHSLIYVDLSGIEPHEALQIEPTGSVATAIDMMVQAKTGLVSVVNDRNTVIGEFTEHDVFRKLACRVEDLDDQIVGDWMTETIAAVPPTTPIADGIHLMAEVGHRYLVLLNETGHAMGVLTFRDIATYFETALEVV